MRIITATLECNEDFSRNAIEIVIFKDLRLSLASLWLRD